MLYFCHSVLSFDSGEDFQREEKMILEHGALPRKEEEGDAMRKWGKSMIG